MKEMKIDFRGFPRNNLDNGGKTLYVRHLSRDFHDSTKSTMYTNPLTTRNSPDPAVMFHNGFYYAVECAGEHGASVDVSKSRRLADLYHAERKRVYTSTHPVFQFTHWAPELWHLDGAWYVYTCAIQGADNATRRVIVLKGTTQDPQDPFEFAGALELGDCYGLDSSILHAPNGKRYLLWAGSKIKGIHYPTQLYIAEMESPVKMKTPGDRLMLREAEHPWERVTADGGEARVVEGPACLVRNGVVSVVYSCNGFEDANYCLGMLVCRNASDPDFRNWKWEASPVPVFAKTAKVWGPGHNCFTVSPDGTEDWILYHCKASPEKGAFRVANMQKVQWEKDLPVLGAPVDPGLELEEPSGS